jgi:hypothetical protein
MRQHIHQFSIVKYLRYALLKTDGAHPKCSLTIPCGKRAKKQVATLAAETEGVLTEVMADLKLGDRVHLDWIEVKMPDGEVVSQCQSLWRLSAKDEEKLVAQYPEPQIMGRKQAPAELSASVAAAKSSEETGAAALAAAALFGTKKQQLEQNQTEKGKGTGHEQQQQGQQELEGGAAAEVEDASDSDASLNSWTVHHHQPSPAPAAPVLAAPTPAAPAPAQTPSSPGVVRGLPTADLPSGSLPALPEETEMPIGEWLARISYSSSLGEYASAFVDYGYSDTNVLLELEEADLQEAFDDLSIKVKPAHRKLILRAFRKQRLGSPLSRVFVPLLMRGPAPGSQGCR